MPDTPPAQNFLYYGECEMSAWRIKMKSLDKILKFVAQQKNGATRYEVYEALEYCWQTVNASMYTLEQEGVIVKTEDSRLSIWNKPNVVYKAVR